MKVLSLLAAFFLVGCGTVPEVIGPDGTIHRLVSCQSTVSCYRMAREVCQGNYEIVNTVSKLRGGDIRVPSETEMLVRCESDKELPSDKPINRDGDVAEDKGSEQRQHRATEQ